jgi:hypothetical protein
MLEAVTFSASLMISHSSETKRCSTAIRSSRGRTIPHCGAINCSAVTSRQAVRAACPGASASIARPLLPIGPRLSAIADIARTSRVRSESVRSDPASVPAAHVKLCSYVRLRCICFSLFEDSRSPSAARSIRRLPRLCNHFCLEYAQCRHETVPARGSPHAQSHGRRLVLRGPGRRSQLPTVC